MAQEAAPGAAQEPENVAAPNDFSLTWAELRQIRAEAARRGFPEQQDFPCLVETGTFLGQTVIPLAGHFQEAHTIEILPEAFEAARLAAWSAETPIKFYLGRSSQQLPLILPTLIHPTVFFLDAHYSGMVTGGAHDDVPLLEEIRAIDELFQPAAFVIADDLELFGKITKFEHADSDWRAAGSKVTDWTAIDVGAVTGSVRSERLACAFPWGDRYVLALHADASRAPPKMTRTPACQLLSSHLWISTPGGDDLDLEALAWLRARGRGWRKVADRIHAEYGAGADLRRRLRGSPSEDNAGVAFDEARLTRSQVIEMHYAFFREYAADGFQEILREAWAAAGDDRGQQLKVKQEVCLPVQLPIVAQYGFEASGRGVIDCLGTVRRDFSSDKTVMDMGAWLYLLTDPAKQALQGLQGPDWLRNLRAHLAEHRIVGADYVANDELQAARAELLAALAAGNAPRLRRAVDAAEEALVEVELVRRAAAELVALEDTAS